MLSIYAGTGAFDWGMASGTVGFVVWFAAVVWLGSSTVIHFLKDSHAYVVAWYGITFTVTLIIPLALFAGFVE